MPDASPTPTPTARRGPVDVVSTWARRDARFDLPASLVVFLVAVPLSLGIAVASGAPVAAGLIAAAVGGIVAGTVGGSPLQVSGPAAGLTVVVAETVNQFGWQVTCAITALAGVLQIALGASRVARFALAISPTVVRAMLAGIGLSIVLGQLNVAFGGRSMPSALENVRAFGGNLASLDVGALAAALVVIAILVAWPRLPAAVRRVPGPLAAIVATTAIAAVALPSVQRVDLGGSLLSQVGLPQLPDGTYLAFAGAVLTIMLIASIESLLSAVAVDKLHDGPRSRLDRELMGQGAANTASGLLGGLPVTGVIVRSSTNVAAGARTRASAILHGVWVLVFSLLLVSVIELIPLAALAGLLIVMGTQLVKPRDVLQARRRHELWIYVVTVAGVLLLNLVEGVMIGLAGALVLVLWRLVRVDVEATHKGDALDGREHWIVEVRGSLSFLAIPQLLRALGGVTPGQVVEIDVLADYLDPAAEEQLDQWAARYVTEGGSVDLQRTGPAESVGDGVASKASPLTQRAWLPWSSWQTTSSTTAAEGDTSGHHPLALGVREFHRRTSPALKPVFEGLTDGQAPDAVFLGCVDSRVVPNVLTSSGPGDLFTVRTMGNLVPDPDSEDASVSAPVLYAVRQLGVRTVVVCGHSACGAMNACLTAGGDDGHVDRWMKHADPSVEAWRAEHPVGVRAAEEGYGEADQLSQVNIAVGVQRLRDLLGPEDADDVRVLGLFFRIGDGTLHLLRDDRFVPLTDSELDEMAYLA